MSQLRREDLLRRLDHDQLPNLDNLEPALRDAAFDSGNVYSVPWATGTTGIGYDTSVFSEPPGYDVFLDDTYRDRLSILDETRNAMALALFSLGEDPNTTDAATIAAAGEELAKMKAVIKGFDSAGYLDGLADGSLVAAQAYSTDLLQARARNPQLAFTLPDAGGLRWVDAMAVPDGAGRPERAHAFIDFYLEPENAARNTVAVKVDTGNQAARELLPAEVLADPVIFPAEDVLARLSFTADLGAAEDRYSAAFAHAKA